ncbi:MAG: ImmA/IrrE family metallo-endopeptidase [Candidatus Aenigmarchaeota archaeon]|nr:ImmA/IrrE family metallo-endopeptidase [Candidatus Aenigmarchaeota archaeon]
MKGGKILDFIQKELNYTKKHYPDEKEFNLNELIPHIIFARKIEYTSDLNFEDSFNNFLSRIYKGFEPPFPVEKVAKAIGVKAIEYYELSRKGFAVLFHGNWYIGVNKNDSLIEQKFTIAHETSHIGLNYTSNKELLPLGTEDTCDYIARLIIMPSYDFENNAKKLDCDIEKLSGLYSCPSYMIETRIEELKI